MTEPGRSYTEFAVMDDLGNVLPPRYGGYEAAYAFVKDRERYQEEARVAAEAEEAADFPTGNEAWWRYNKGFGGPPVKGRKWHVVSRHVTEWRRP